MESTRLGSEALPHAPPARAVRGGAGRAGARAVATLPAALAAAAIAAAALVAAPTPSGERAPAKLLASASGGLVLTNTKAGEPIVSAAGMLPGEPVSGIVRIGNAGFERTKLQLVAQRIRSLPGPHGGDLAEALRIRVQDLSAKRTERTLYNGRLKKMGRLSAGGLGPFKGHRYRITVRVPESGTPRSASTGDNALQGSQATLNLLWRAG